MNALLTVGGDEGGFLDAGPAGWVFASHAAAFDAFETDPAAVAEQYLGAPYLWGGRDSLGLTARAWCSRRSTPAAAPARRDSDQQMAAFAPVEAAALARGDLVFWRGHVGMMLDADRLIHANARHMAVAIEPLTEAVERIRAAGAGQPIGFRRP
ncbi:MAG: NlpC/P60 family protein [Caulobacteraceae bacterium]